MIFILYYIIIIVKEYITVYIYLWYRHVLYDKSLNISECLLFGLSADLYSIFVISEYISPSGPDLPLIYDSLTWLKRLYSLLPFTVHTIWLNIFLKISGDHCRCQAMCFTYWLFTLLRLSFVIIIAPSARSYVSVKSPCQAEISYTHTHIHTHTYTHTHTHTHIHTQHTQICTYFDLVWPIVLFCFQLNLQSLVF